MFVRTDPRDNTRRVVTAQGAQDIEDERAKRDGSWADVKAQREREAAIRLKLADKWHMSPESVDSHDVEWSILNEDAINAMKHANWQDYMYICWDRAIALLNRGSLEQASAAMLQACYLQLNGPNNMNPNSVDMSSVYSPFEPRLDRDQVSGELPPIRRVLEQLGVSVDEGLDKFGQLAEHESGHLPISWPKARELLKSWLTDP